MSTEHPAVGYVPSVFFLGTHFENLRIAGEAVNFSLDLDMLGEKPANDVPYLSHPEFLGRVQSQNSRFSFPGVAPKSSLARFGGYPVALEGGEAIEFSLVHQVSGNFQASTVGHVIQIPNFGTVGLATVKLSQSGYANGTAQATTLQLTMVETQTAEDGTTGTGTTITNGVTRP